jgi:hypothetical protein
VEGTIEVGYRVETPMSVINFPKRPSDGADPPEAGPRGPKPIFVFAPLYEQLDTTPRKLCLGYTRELAKIRFYEGGLASHIEPRVFSLATAPKWVKFQLVSQLLILRLMEQPLSPVDEDAFTRLGDDPHRYGKGPRLAKLPKRR